MQGVKLTELIEKMNLKNLTPDIELVDKYVPIPVLRKRMQDNIRIFFELNVERWRPATGSATSQRG